MEIITLLAVISLGPGGNQPNPQVFWNLEPDHETRAIVINAVPPCRNLSLLFHKY
jgi:hypothetical protein